MGRRKESIERSHGLTICWKSKNQIWAIISLFGALISLFGLFLTALTKWPNTYLLTPLYNVFGQNVFFNNQCVQLRLSWQNYSLFNHFVFIHLSIGNMYNFRVLEKKLGKAKPTVGHNLPPSLIEIGLTCLKIKATALPALPLITPLGR